MDFLFGQRKTATEKLRQNQRALQRAVRDLEREKIKLEMQEKKLIIDIKKSARAGQMGPCKIMAKDLVRTRRYIQKFYEMKAQLQAVSLRVQTLQSNQALAEAMKGVTKSINMMNRQINLPQISKIMMDFEKEAEIMDMKEEMMNDTIDDAMDEAEDEEEENEIVMKVLDEIGIDLDQKMADAPISSIQSGSKVSSNRVAVAEGVGGSNQGVSSQLDDDAALQARLDELRKL